MTVRFVEEARLELLDGISYYKDIRVELGARFKDEVDRCISVGSLITQTSTAYDHRPIVALTCQCFLIMLLTSFVAKLFGS